MSQYQRQEFLSCIHKLMAALSAPVLVVAIFLAALYAFQNKLLYHPSRVSAADYAPSGTNLWIASGKQKLFASGTILGLIADPAAGPPAAGTAIVFHGNAGHAGHRGYYVQQLNSLRMRVILAEYPGYGPRSGKPDETVLIDDAVKLVTQAHQQHGQPLWLIGESLGAGVVAAIAARTPSAIRGIVLITPWNRLVEVASHHYPFLPVRWLLTSHYDSVSSLAEFHGPTLVIVADEDTIVPSDLGLDLYQSLDQPKRLILIEGAGHNDWTKHVGPSFWTKAMQWLQQAQTPH